MRKIRGNLGEWKFWLDRYLSYMSRVSSIMAVATFFIVSAASWWWLVPVFVLSILFIVYVDKPHIAPKEYEFISKINPWMRELMDEVKK
jgi:hypothetical protein